MKKKSSTTLTKAVLAAMIDHTFLKASGDADAVERLCAEAKRYRFACAMVNPSEVRHAVRMLGRSKVRVGTVVNFPLGQGSVSAAVAEAELAIAEGARDIDFVINIRKLKHGDVKELQRELAFWAATCSSPDVVSKLIIECCYLSDREKVKACRMAKKAGFDFVKTSTGFGTGGATVHDVALMRRTVGPDLVQIVHCLFAKIWYNMSLFTRGMYSQTWQHVVPAKRSRHQQKSRSRAY